MMSMIMVFERGEVDIIDFAINYTVMYRGRVPTGTGCMINLEGEQCYANIISWKGRLEREREVIGSLGSILICWDVSI